MIGILFDLLLNSFVIGLIFIFCMVNISDVMMLKDGCEVSCFSVVKVKDGIIEIKNCVLYGIIIFNRFI